MYVRIFHLLYALILITGTASWDTAWALQQLYISKQANYETQDRTFSRTDTLYVKAVAPNIDDERISHSTYTLEPVTGNAASFTGSFTNHHDHSYSMSLPLHPADSTISEWRLRVRIEDEGPGKLDARFNLTLFDEDQDHNDDDGRDEEEDKNREDDEEKKEEKSDGEGDQEDEDREEEQETTVSAENRTPGLRIRERHTQLLQRTPGLSVPGDRPVSSASSMLLHPNYPNPFTSSTTLHFEVLGSQPLPVQLHIFDALGRRVQTVLSGTYSPGVYRIAWSGRMPSGGQLPRGMYVYRLVSDTQSLTRSLSLNR